jgi:biopolymer transport protein ExbB
MKNTTPSTAKPVAKKAENKGSGSAIFATVAIPAIIILCILLYKFLLLNPANFTNGDPEKGHPIDGNLLGTIGKGGFVVPVLMSFGLMVIVFSIERFLTIAKATGKGSVPAFVRKIQGHLAADNVSEAIKECDKQQGSVGNVVNAVLHKYGQLLNEPGMNKDQKVVAIQKELEEATALELPMLEKNLVIIATLASVATLGGLFGTVLGMIRAFSALANAGAPDAAALSTGISEALINTALGIGTSGVAIIMYNYFTTRIDSLTYAIDEAGFSIAQNFQSKVQA